MTNHQNQDLQAELAVIGAVLLDNRILAHIPATETDDFTRGEHRFVFSAIRNLEADGRPFDVVTIGDELERLERLRSDNPDEQTAGMPLRDRCVFVMAEAMLNCPTVERVIEYAAILRKHRVTRAALRELASLIRAGQSGDLEGDDLVSEAAGAIMRLSDVDKGETGKTVAQVVREEFDRLRSDLANPNAASTGMPTGLTKLDGLTGGLPYAVPTLVLARPGAGKTTLVANIAWCAAHLGNDTPLIYTYEDNWSSFGMRAMAQSSGVPTEAIRARQFERSHLNDLGVAKERLKRRREVVVKATGMTVEELIRDARSRRMRGSGDGSTVGRLIIVDYIQRMPEPHGSNRNERLGMLSRRLSEMAAKDEIALLVCSQVNRGVEGRDDNVPRMSDARDCGELEQDAKLILGLYRPWKYGHPPTSDGPEAKGVAPATMLEIHVLKNHNGQTEKHAEVFWDLETHTICDSAHDLRARRRMGDDHAQGN